MKHRLSVALIARRRAMVFYEPGITAVFRADYETDVSSNDVCGDCEGEFFNIEYPGADVTARALRTIDTLMKLPLKLHLIFFRPGFVIRRLRPTGTYISLRLKNM